jgi:succinyl-CoA synthetase beta subunit
VLAWYGIPVTREALVNSEEAALSASVRLGYPVVLKLMSPDIIHKTEARAVKTGLKSEIEVRSAYAELLAAGRGVVGARIDGVLVQEMVPPGIELILGAARDAQFGPGIVCGLGGTLAEVLKESTLLLPPIDPNEAASMITETKIGELLRGVRGRRAADLDALIDVTLRLSELFSDLGPAVEAIDINPLVVYEAERGMIVVDASILLSSGPMRPPDQEEARELPMGR